MNNYVLDMPEMLGTWWLPEKPEQTIVGLFSFDRVKGGRIRLHNVPSHYELGGRYTPLGKYPIILGQLETGELVTVLNCLQISKNINSNLISGINTSIVADRVVVGAHYETADEILTKKVTISYSLLRDWLGDNLVSLNSSLDRVDIESGRRHNYRLNENVEFQFDTTVERNWKLDRLDLLQSSTITIRFSEPVRINEVYGSFMAPMRNFLSHALQIVVHPLVTHFEGYMLNDLIPNQLLSLVRHNGIEKYHEMQQITHHEVLFFHRDISLVMEKALKCWFDLFQKASSPLHLFFGRHTREVYSIDQFLVLARVVEGLHRATNSTSNIIPKSRYKKLRDNLFQVLKENQEIPKNLRQRLWESTAYANEWSLKDRLHDLLFRILAEYSSYTGDLIGDPDRFIKRVVRYRNDLTHYPSDRAVQEAQGDPQLFNLIKSLDIIISIWLNELIHIPKEQTEAWLNRSQWYSWLTEEKN